MYNNRVGKGCLLPTTVVLILHIKILYIILTIIKNLKPTIKYLIFKWKKQVIFNVWNYYIIFEYNLIYLYTCVIIFIFVPLIFS